MGLQTGVVTDNIRDDAKGYHSLAQQKLKAEEGFCADGSRSEALIRDHDALTNPYIGQSGRELYFGLDDLGDPQTVVAVHNYYFASGHHTVSELQFGGVLNVLVQLDHRSGP